MSSISELSELSSEEFQADPTSSDSKKRKVKSPSTYTIKDALKQPTSASYATDWLSKQIKSGDIKVDPEYQRSVVWSDTKQSKLIDSILRNFYVPPVLFCIQEDSNGNHTRICIDGKQRLTSIRRFFDGLIPHKDGKLSLYFKQADSSKNVRLLPEPLRKQFRNKTLVCIEYRDLSNAHEREMFQRVQLGMALTTGEQLQSFDGPMAQFVHKMDDELFKVAHIETPLNMAIDRGRGFQSLVQIIACIARLPDYTHATHAQQTKLLQCQGTLPERIKEIQTKSERVLRLLVAIASDPQLCSEAFSLPPRANRNSPVEFCFSALLIAMRIDEPDVRSLELAQAIGKMRATMRAIHVDMRSNSMVSMSFWNYLNGRDYGAPQAGPSTESTATTTPAAKKFRIKAPPTPQTPTRPQDSRGSHPTMSANPRRDILPRSESSSQFHELFGGTVKTPL